MSPFDVECERCKKRQAQSTPTSELSPSTTPTPSVILRQENCTLFKKIINHFGSELHKIFIVNFEANTEPVIEIETKNDEYESNRKLEKNCCLVFFIIIFVIFFTVIKVDSYNQKLEKQKHEQQKKEMMSTNNWVWVHCIKCGGSGQEVVYVRNDGGVVPCDFCGAGMLFYCGHPGYRSCSRCKSTGLEWDNRLHLHKRCSLCLGKGYRFCTACNGTGGYVDAKYQKVIGKCINCSGYGGQWIQQY